MFRCYYAQLNENESYLRSIWRVLTCGRLGRCNVGFHESAGSPSSDLLAGCYWQDLHVGSSCWRMGNSWDWFGSCHDFQWCILPFRRDVPHQPQEQYVAIHLTWLVVDANLRSQVWLISGFHS